MIVSSELMIDVEEPRESLPHPLENDKEKDKEQWQGTTRARPLQRPLRLNDNTSTSLFILPTLLFISLPLSPLLLFHSSPRRLFRALFIS
jgi:hypothetical protein